MIESTITGLILGFVQGLTEFLPVSSSGHLILVRDIFNLSVTNGLFFDVMLHLATGLAVIVYFRNDLKQMILRPKENQILWLAIILGTIPAMVFGLFFSEELRDPYVVVLALIGGSVLFLIAEKFATQNRILTIGKGAGIGLFQALALIPGVSRSGATISGGLLLGMKRDEAAKFSFLLGLPIIFGASILEGLRSIDVFINGEVSSGLIVGVITSFVTGMVAVHYLLKFLKNNSLKVFAWYRIILALLILFYIT